MKMDFDQYAYAKGMTGPIAESWRRAFEEHALSRLTGNPPGSVLDFGMGDGRFFREFRKYTDAERIYGVEVSSVRVNRAKAAGWDNAILVPDTRSLPFGDDLFDFVNMVEVIEHIAFPLLKPILEEIRRVMKPGGVLLVTTPNYPIKRLYDLVDAFSASKWARLRDDPTHVTFFNRRKLLATLGNCFQIAESGVFKEGFLYQRFRKDFLCHKLLVVCAKQLSSGRGCSCNEADVPSRQDS